MLCIIITLSLLSVLSVDGIEPETGPHPTRAVSTQSYHRGDVPLSYTITSYHDYTTPTIRPDNRVYAPIYAVNNHVPQHPTNNDQINQPPLQPTYKEQLKLSLYNQYQAKENTFQTTEKRNYKNLEPGLAAKKGPFYINKHKYFVPGHNVAVSPKFRYRSPLLSDLYKNYQEPVQSQKIVVPKYIVHEKQKKPILVQTQIVKTEPEPTHLQNAGFPVVPIDNLYANNIDVSQNVHLQNEVLFPQLPQLRAPRLHLNTARVYGIAHLPHQAPEPTVNKEKPPTHTQAIIVPQSDTNEDKTLLYPVQDFQRYPIQVV